jgi:prepilin-type processing-associated H-X9-DG protein
MRRGITVTELLVVCATLAVLISLLLPAVGQTRETGRALACRNHLRQIGLASLNLESAHRTLPSASVNAIPWTDGYQRDSGFFHAILPFLAWPATFDPHRTTFDPAHWDIVEQRVATLECPSAIGPRRIGPYSRNLRAEPADLGRSVAISDYVFSGGYVAAPVRAFALAELHEGVGVVNLPGGSGVRLAEITDGLGHTFLGWESLAGSSAVREDTGFTFTEIDFGNVRTGVFTRNGKLVEIGDPATFRSYCHAWAGLRVGYLSARYPLAINATNGLGKPFSLHAGTANFVFCDGAVRSISETVDSTVVMHCASIAGHEVVTLPD